jgi:outer membrane protein
MVKIATGVWPIYDVYQLIKKNGKENELTILHFQHFSYICPTFIVKVERHSYHMKNSTIVSVVLGIAVALLYLLHFTSNKSSIAPKGIENSGGGKSISIAYVKMDSVLFTYALAKKLTSNLQSNQETFKKEYSIKRIKFEKEAAAFQEKVQRGGFLTEERAKLEQERLQGQQQEIERLDYELTQKLNEMQAQINQQIVDSISSFLKNYNADKKYDFILNSASMLEGTPKYNITKDVAEGLNKRYKP